MSTSPMPPEIKHNQWIVLKNVAFRFLFVFLVFTCNPWSLFGEFPGMYFLQEPIFKGETWIVEQLNAHVFRIKDVLVPINGSGDTSFAWARLMSFALLTLIIGIVWSIFDRSRLNYGKLDFMLTILVRYTLVYYALNYGIIKVFSLQMPFPNESVLATPLGDLLPMRLSWVFFGYSTSFQMFGGFAELLVAGLLLFRLTMPLGALLSFAVFMQVWVLNLSYDIPVKIFSGQLLLLSAYLVWLGRSRYIAFFFSNKAIPPRFENVPFARWGKFRRWRMAIKILSMSIYVVSILIQISTYLESVNAAPVFFPCGNGFYELEMKISAGDTLQNVKSKTEVWSDIIVHSDGTGSLSPIDKAFRTKYGRAYFAYEADSAKKEIKFKRSDSDSLAVYEFRYALPEPQKLVLTSQQNSNRLELHFRKVNRHFQLTERQFHWLSESNR